MTREYMLTILRSFSRPSMEDKEAIAAQIQADSAEIEWLRRVVAWCRPRLKSDVYRRTLDTNLRLGPTEPDVTPVIQSER